MQGGGGEGKGLTALVPEAHQGKHSLVEERGFLSHTAWFYFLLCGIQAFEASLSLGLSKKRD